MRLPNVVATAGAVLAALAAWSALSPARPSFAAVRLPLTVTDALETDGTITVETADWKLVFDRLYNGGIHQWFDLALDPGETDSLAGALAGTFPYSHGALFGYQAYLHDAPAMEFMTTVGINPGPGSLELSVLESTPARVRIRQRGQPRLNNGEGPVADPFPEMGLITATTLWTIYPTGKVHIDFTTEIAPGGVTIDSGPGGGGKGIDASGSNVVVATAGNDFRASGVLPGDTIESSTGGFGPVRITSRPTPTRLVLASTVPAGTGLDYTVRRHEIAGETISIHGDGDPGFQLCGSRPWMAGSVDKPFWDDSPFPQLVPNLPGQFLIAQWAREGRQAGSLLAFFEQPWPDPNLAVFDSCFYEDVSYTQIGRFVRHVPQEHHLHLLAQLGSNASCTTPSIQSVGNALPFGIDYRTPHAEALVGTLDTGGETAAAGFDPGTGAYGVTAASVAPSRCGAASPPCWEAIVRFDTQGGGRGGAQYRTPAVLLHGFPVDEALVAVEASSDGGATFAPLSTKDFNLTGTVEEAALGAGERLFQYLETIPSSATGASAFAVRFRGPVSPAPPPPPLEPCSAVPASGCRIPGKGTLKLAWDGGKRNKLVWKWDKGTAPVEEFGFPSARCGNGFALCVYDAVAGAPSLSIATRVEGGRRCDGKPCWKALPPKGFRFKDKTLAQSGLQDLVLLGGKAGSDKLSALGKGAELPLPPPALPDGYFRNEGDVVVQLVGDDGACWETRFDADGANNAARSYKASFTAP